MTCLVCPECKKANLRAEPIIEDDICDNCGSNIVKYRSKYGSRKAYVRALERYVHFCNKCGEYITKDTGCSNPLCPEKIGDC